MTSPIDISLQFGFGGTLALGVALGIVALLAVLLFVIVRRDTTLLYFSIACVVAASLTWLPRETMRGWPTSLREFSSAAALPLAVTGFAFALVASVQRMFANQCVSLRFALVPMLVLAGWESSIVYLQPGLLGRGIGLGAGLAGWFLFRHRAGCGWVYAGLGASWLVTFFDQGSLLLVTFFPVLVVLVLAAVVVHLIALRLALEASIQARLTAARLEIELLKKSIQPHFLINTLTALTEAIETTPKLAVSMIDSLAEEFRILAAVSAKPMVSLDVELDLCRAHLRLMSLRCGVTCNLVVEKATDVGPIPPGILHTAIENGFTHQIIANGSADFKLTAECSLKETRLVLRSPGTPRPRSADRRAGSGTGLRYIRARLEEAFPGQWQLDGRELPSGAYETVFLLGAERK